jgi:hypothetical protein
MDRVAASPVFAIKVIVGVAVGLGCEAAGGNVLCGPLSFGAAELAGYLAQTPKKDWNFEGALSAFVDGLVEGAVFEAAVVGIGWAAGLIGKLLGNVLGRVGAKGIRVDEAKIEAKLKTKVRPEEPKGKAAGGGDPVVDDGTGGPKGPEDKGPGAKPGDNGPGGDGGDGSPTGDGHSPNAT